MPRRPSFSTRRLPYGLEILHEDRDILVVDKPAGLLSISTERESARTAYFALMDHVRKGNAKSRNRVFIVHRLDRETSGVMLLAKSEDAKFRLQGGWDETQKTYLAIVHGKLTEKSGTITSYLAESSTHVVYSIPNAGAGAGAGKLSHTAYRVARETRNLSLLEVDLLTGRKNQIRVHMSEAGHPIVGDRKYGTADGQNVLMLHAYSITFPHPFSGETVTFAAPVPDRFHQLMGPIDARDLDRKR